MLTPGDTTSTRQREALDHVEAELRAILVPYEDRLETAAIYGMEVLRRPGAKAHDWFAGVQRVEGAVKFNLLPMHSLPDLLDGISQDLRRHKTGASVLRFSEIDEHQAGELEDLVGRAFQAYMKGD